MDKYDRALQKELLQMLYNFHPEPLHRNDYHQIVDLFIEENILIANLVYLHEHGLITNCMKKGMDGIVINLGLLYITNRGIDFIRDDGGLGAILNVQTVKFHDNTIIALEDIIRVANLPEPQKKALSAKLRELGEDATKRLTLELLTKGVLNLPAALPIIEKFLHKS